MANTSQTVQNTLGKAADKAKDMASNVADKTKDMASNVADKARDYAGVARDKAEDLTTRAGSGMTALADTIREHAPDSGFAGNVASTVADNLESGGRYLQEEGLSGVCNDVGTLIKRNPIPALLIGIGFGFLVARAMSRD